jgi:hypothetical protein
MLALRKRLRRPLFERGAMTMFLVDTTAFLRFITVLYTTMTNHYTMKIDDYTKESPLSLTEFSMCMMMVLCASSSRRCPFPQKSGQGGEPVMKSLTNDESMRLLVCIDSTTDFEGGTEYSTVSSVAPTVSSVAPTVSSVAPTVGSVAPTVGSGYSSDSYSNSMNSSGKSQDSMADLIGIVKPPLDLEEGIAA